MSEPPKNDSETDAAEAATYDVDAVQAKWLQVWDKLDHFRTDDGSPKEKRYALTMYPYPSGDLHMGHAEVFALHDVIARYWRLRGYEVLNPMGWDSFGLPAENAAIRNNEHPATYTYANIETQFDVDAQLRPELRLVAPPAHLRPGVLPLDPVAVPEVPRARSGLPQEQPGQLVPERPDRAGQRAGRRRHVRALRRGGHQARAEPVVLQDHRLRPAAAGLPRRPGADLAGSGDHRPAQLDRPLRRVPTSSSSVEGRDEPIERLHDAARHAVRHDVHGGRAPTPQLAGRAASPTSSDQRSRLTGAGPQGDRDRPAVHDKRPKTGVFLGVYAINPVNGERIPVWVADYVLADYGTGAIMAVPSAGPARLGLREELRPADRANGAAARRLGGRRLQRRGPRDQLRQRRVSA